MAQPKLKHLQVNHEAVKNILGIAAFMKLAIKDSHTSSDIIEMDEILTKLGWKAAEITIIINTLTKTEESNDKENTK